MAPHSSTLAWKIPWMEEPGGLQSMGLLRVRHDWTTSLSLFTFMHWRRKWQPTPVFLPGESQGRGAWWAAVCGVIQNRTRLKRLSRSNSGFTVCQRKWEFLDQWFIWNCSDFVSLIRKLGCGAFALSWKYNDNLLPFKSWLSSRIPKGGVCSKWPGFISVFPVSVVLELAQLASSHWSTQGGLGSEITWWVSDQKGCVYACICVYVCVFWYIR